MPAFEAIQLHTTSKGRPQKNNKESLCAPISVRLYDNELDAIKERMFEFDLSRNDVIQKCVQVGIFVFPLLNWIMGNADTISVLAKRYHRARNKGSVQA